MIENTPIEPKSNLELTSPVLTNWWPGVLFLNLCLLAVIPMLRLEPGQFDLLLGAVIGIWFVCAINVCVFSLRSPLGHNTDLGTLFATLWVYWFFLGGATVVERPLVFRWIMGVFIALLVVISLVYRVSERRAKVESSQPSG